jgi:hypothetical protein
MRARGKRSSIMNFPTIAEVGDFGRLKFQLAKNLNRNTKIQNYGILPLN